jgi:hypothetical protein
MWRLILIVVILCVLFGVGMTVSRAIGYRQQYSPPSEIVPHLYRNDCQTPCFMGITVGKTSRLEAVILLASGTIPDHRREVNWNGNRGTIEYRLLDNKSIDVVNLYFDFEHDKVSNVRVYVRGPTANLTLGNFIQHYGIPICILAEPDLIMDRVPGMRAAFQIDNTLVEVQAVAPPQWNTRIRFIGIKVSNIQQPNFCTCSGKVSSHYYDMPGQTVIPHYTPESFLLAPCPDPN